MEYDEKHKSILNTSVQILRERLPELVAVIQFGSFGTAYERDESDLDLAVLSNGPQFDPVKLWNLSQEIAGKINKNVDVIDLRQASSVFCMEVLTSGTTIYCSNDLILANFDNLAISMYLRFQEERKEILEDYEKGIFYAG